MQLWNPYWQTNAKHLRYVAANSRDDTIFADVVLADIFILHSKVRLRKVTVLFCSASVNPLLLDWYESERASLSVVLSREKKSCTHLANDNEYNTFFCATS